MYIVIAGCGRLGSFLATSLSVKGHDVAVIDSDSGNFSSLASGFDGITVTGVPIDEDILRKAGIEKANIMAAVTQDDNLNIMAAQIAEKIFKVGKVLVRIGDPQKEEFFARNYGLDTISLIVLGSDYIERVIGTSPVRNGEVNAR